MVVLLNAVALAIYRDVGTFDHPRAGWLMLAAMVAWTGFVTWAYRRPERRGVALLVADLAVTLALLGLTPVVKGPWFDATVPGFWVMGAMLAWAVRYRWRGGLLAATLIGGLDLLLRETLTQTNYGNVFLVMVGGGVVGYLCGSLQEMAAERDRAQRAAAAAAERVRLARAVHDGVLQVLALVQRRGAELGGQGGELARLAGEQESRLRTLIREQDAVADQRGSGTVDLAAGLSALSARAGVEVVVPAGAVELPAGVAAEVVAVVGACLDNVATHVGEGAAAWVLLEAFGDRVEVSVRDEGPGIPAGRLAEAEAAGRLGVAQSIRGRVADLGGTATLGTGSFGTEWELTVPRPSGPVPS